MITRLNPNRYNRHVQSNLRTNLPIPMTNKSTKRTMRPRVFKQGQTFRYRDPNVKATRRKTMMTQQNRYYTRRYHDPPNNGTNVRGKNEIGTRRLPFRLTTPNYRLNSGVHIMPLYYPNSVLRHGMRLRRLNINVNLQINLRPILRENLRTRRRPRRLLQRLLRGSYTVLHRRELQRQRNNFYQFNIRGTNLLNRVL